MSSQHATHRYERSFCGDAQGLFESRNVGVRNRLPRRDVKHKQLHDTGVSVAACLYEVSAVGREDGLFGSGVNDNRFWNATDVGYDGRRGYVDMQECKIAVRCSVWH